MFKSAVFSGDAIFARLVRYAAICLLLLLISIFALLIFNAWPSITAHGWSFFSSREWNPAAKEFGGLVPIYGTLITSAIAMLIAIPISFGIAIFLTELAPSWLRRPLGTVIELLAAIPSIVYGMWGLIVFAPLFSECIQTPLQNLFENIPLLQNLVSGPPLGIGILCASIILAIMTIPYIAAIMRDVFEATPILLKESAYGIGCTTWEVVWKVVIPYTRAGAIGGIMLGFGRALGETMAVAFVIGNTNIFSGVSFNATGNTIASLLANEFAEASSEIHISALMHLALILFLITSTLLILSKLLLKRS